MCVRVCGREMTIVCVCVWERDDDSVCVCGREMTIVCVCVYVCVGGRKRGSQMCV